MRRCWLALALCVAPAVAAADERQLNPDAAKHRDAGNAAYRDKDWAAAAREFEAAYKDDPGPELLYAWAQAEKFAGHCDLALELYKKYLNADISPVNVERARANIAVCEKEVAHAPKPPPPPPPHDEQPPQPPPPETEPGPWYTSRLGDGLVAGSVISAIVGFVYLSKSSGSKDRADTAPSLDAFNADLADATHQREVGGVMLGIGGALLAGGVTVYVLHAHSHSHATVATDGHSLIIGARF